VEEHGKEKRHDVYDGRGRKSPQLYAARAENGEIRGVCGVGNGENGGGGGICPCI